MANMTGVDTGAVACSPDGACGCGQTDARRKLGPGGKAVSGAALVAVAACAVCIVPVALPAFLLAGAGGMLAWLGGASAWVSVLVLAAIGAARLWIKRKNLRARTGPPATMLLMMVAVTFLAASGEPARAFELTSPSVSDGHWDQKYLAKECGGQNVSPALSWKDPPQGTKSFVLTLFDRDALDGFGWWHWQVLKIPATAMGLPEGAGVKGGKGLPKGAIQGKADLGSAHYLGPCTDQGPGVHHFVFTLYALKSAEAETERDASPGMILADVMREQLGKAQVTYTYGP